MSEEKATQVEVKTSGLKEQIAKLEAQVKDLTKTNEELRNSEYSKRKELQEVVAEKQKKEELIVAKESEIALLKAELNKLASLFDEYIVNFKDQNKLLQVFVRNTQNIEAFLQSKIDAYNKGPGATKENKL
jgi:predicted RNase H-like nuclease (RuvC/YqgF family)